MCVCVWGGVLREREGVRERQRRDRGEEKIKTSEGGEREG